MERDVVVYGGGYSAQTEGSYPTQTHSQAENKQV